MHTAAQIGEAILDLGSPRASLPDNKNLEELLAAATRHEAPRVYLLEKIKRPWRWASYDTETCVSLIASSSFWASSIPCGPV